MQTITDAQVQTIATADTFEQAMQTLWQIAPGFEDKVAFIATIRGDWYPACWVETLSDAAYRVRTTWETAKYGRELKPAERSA